VNQEGKCPWCSAHYSTREELARHLDLRWEHLRERLDAALDLVDAATCFQFGDFYAEHLVDQDGDDYGWVVSRNGKWEQRERLTREQAIERARQGKA
jgi:DNA-binding SARP family transcriptional activator